MNIIFLDFDGVLVNKKSWYIRNDGHATADPSCVEQLNRIIAVAGARIVVSSTWRIGMKLPELAKLLKEWRVAGELIGKTPEAVPAIPGGLVVTSRGDEIRRWFEKNTGYWKFVILDDDDDMDPYCDRLIQTKFDPGLTGPDADKAIALFK